MTIVTARPPYNFVLTNIIHYPSFLATHIVSETCCCKKAGKKACVFLSRNSMLGRQKVCNCSPIQNPKLRFFLTSKNNNMQKTINFKGNSILCKQIRIMINRNPVQWWPQHQKHARHHVKSTRCFFILT